MLAHHRPRGFISITGLVLLGATLLGSAGLGGPAQAGVFDSSAVANLNLISITPSVDLAGLTVERIEDNTDPRFSGGANASADIAFTDDPLGLGVGFNSRLSVSTNGSGDAGADTEASVLIGIENATGETLELVFELIYSLGANASIPASSGRGNPGDAFADALLDLFVFGFVIDGPNGVFDGVLADALAGIADAPRGDSIRFTLELLAGERADIDLVVSSFAGATGVPTPPAIALLAVGLLGLGLQRRRTGTAGL